MLASFSFGLKKQNKQKIFFSILTDLLQFTTLFFYFIMTTLNPKTIGWLIFASVFSIALKQLFAIFVYYHYRMFRKEFKSLITKYFWF